MQVSVLRKGSKGLQGTYDNANHHAKPAIQIVDRLVRIVTKQSKYIETWRQGHNIHIVTLPDGRSLEFRPFRKEIFPDAVTWGVEVLVHVSRKQRIPLLQLFNDEQVDLFEEKLVCFAFNGGLILQQMDKHIGFIFGACIHQSTQNRYGDIDIQTAVQLIIFVNQQCMGKVGEVLFLV